MVKEKQQIIESEGVTVNIFDISLLLGLDKSEWSPSAVTKALIGKASKGNNTSLSLEAYRKGIFLPGSNIKNGNIVENTVNGDYYIVIASSDEIIDSEIASIHVLMLKCNAVIDIVGEEETADDVGNIFRKPIFKVSDLSVYVQSDKLDVAQYKPGLYLDNRYTLYLPFLPLSMSDKIILKTIQPNLTLKIEGIDSLSYENLLVVSVVSTLA